MKPQPPVYRVIAGPAAPRYDYLPTGERRRCPIGKPVPGYVLQFLKLGAFTYSWGWVTDWDEEPSKGDVAAAISAHSSRQERKAKQKSFEPYFVVPPEASAA